MSEKEGQPLEILINLLVDSENQPHQFIDSPKKLALELLKTGFTGDTDPQNCPNWGRLPSGHFGPCHKCLNCLIRDGAFDWGWDDWPEPFCCADKLPDYFLVMSNEERKAHQ